MAWDFSTDPEFQEHLDWMDEFVRREIWPLETIAKDMEWDQLMRAMAPLYSPSTFVAHGLSLVSVLYPELGDQ